MDKNLEHHFNQEIEMAASQLYNAAIKAAKLHDKVHGLDSLEAWQQSKITKASDYLSSVLDSIMHDLAMADLRGDQNNLSIEEKIAKKNEEVLNPPKTEKNKPFDFKTSSLYDLVQNTRNTQSNTEKRKKMPQDIASLRSRGELEEKNKQGVAEGLVSQADEFRVELDDDGQIHLLDGENTVRVSMPMNIWKKMAGKKGRVDEFSVELDDDGQVHVLDGDGTIRVSMPVNIWKQLGKQGVAEGLEDSNIQSAIVDTVERLFRKNEISDYGALEAVRQGVKHHFSKPSATTESAIEGILNILDKRMRKSGNYVDLGRFKEALRQGVAHQLKKQGVAEGWFFKSPEEKAKKAEQHRLKWEKIKKETFDDLLVVIDKLVPELIDDVSLNQFEKAGSDWFSIRVIVSGALLIDDIISGVQPTLKQVSDKITKKLKVFGSVPDLFTLDNTRNYTLKFNQQMMIDKEYIIKLLNQYLILLKQGINNAKEQKIDEELDPFRLERLDPLTRKVLLRMSQMPNPGSWLSASEAYALTLGLQYKNRDPRGWEQEVQHFVDLYRQYSGQGVAEEVDTGEYDARKTQPSSKEDQDKVFAKHKERVTGLGQNEYNTIKSAVENFKDEYGHEPYGQELFDLAYSIGTEPDNVVDVIYGRVVPKQGVAEGSMGGINRSAPAADVSYEDVLSTHYETAQERNADQHKKHKKGQQFARQVERDKEEIKYDEMLNEIMGKMQNDYDYADEDTNSVFFEEIGMEVVGNKNSRYISENEIVLEGDEIVGILADEMITEAEYQGRKVQLNKPMRGDVKKFKVFVKDPKTGNVKKVNFGDPNMRIKKSNPARRKSFRARHNCDNPGPKTKARYWSCRKW